MTDTLDPRETRTRPEREVALLQSLQHVVVEAKLHTDHYKAAFADVDVDRLTSREALAKLPLLRKSDLIPAQEEAAPFGGVASRGADGMARLFLSPGPIAEPQCDDKGDTWRFSRALRAAGFAKGDICHNCFSYHLTPAGFMFDTAARTLGCAVFPGGIGNTETQIQAMRRYGPTAFAGTPDFLKTILEKAEAGGTPITTITKAAVGGGPLFPDLRKWYEDRGITCLQNYGTADVGLIAYETEAKQGLVIDEDVIVEIVRPGTGDPVSEGEVGEVVVTTFDEVYPMIRFATGDLSAILSGECPSGRTNQRLKGWMGRADQTTKIKGMFVHPEQLDKIRKAHPEIGKLRLEVSADGNHDSMVLHCEVDGAPDGLAKQIADTLQAQTRLRGEVVLTEKGNLPNDGKVIDDTRAL